MSATVIVDEERYYGEGLLVAALAQAYYDAPQLIAAMCDGILDPRGRLLGVVRAAAAAVPNEAEQGA